MGNTSKPGRGTNPTNDENEDESPSDRPGLDRFQNPSGKDEDEEDNNENQAIGGGGGSGSGIQAGSGSVVTRDEMPEDGAEEEEPDEEGESGTDTELPETEDGTEQEDDEDADPDVVTILQTVDPLSYTSWDMQPVMRRVTEQYRGQIELRFVPAPVREFDDEIPSPRNGMPLNESLYSDPPSTTELVNRAWIAAMRQGRGYDYLRRLWTDTFARGQNLDDESRLVDIADDMGFDVAQFKVDMDDADLPTGSAGDLPVTRIKTDVPAKVEGYMRYSEFGTKLAPEGITPDAPRDLPEFVHTFGPVETAEVKAAYEYETIGDTEFELNSTNRIKRIEIGNRVFWSYI